MLNGNMPGSLPASPPYSRIPRPRVASDPRLTQSRGLRSVSRQQAQSDMAHKLAPPELDENALLASLGPVERWRFLARHRRAEFAFWLVGLAFAAYAIWHAVAAAVKAVIASVGITAAWAQASPPPLLERLGIRWMTCSWSCLLWAFSGRWEPTRARGSRRSRNSPEKWRTRSLCS
jgi:hypothetical protein